MGSKLALHAAVQVAALLGARVAVADKIQLARQLFELGIEEYKTKQYDAAAASMSKSYSLDPQTPALYALAQSERLAGNCKDAIGHYQKMLETTKDQPTIEAVNANVTLCQQIEAGKKPELDPKANERQDAPTLQIRTVYRTKQKSDGLAIAMFATGGIVLGGSVALFLVARSTRSDADRAQSLPEYNKLYDRADHLRWAGYGVAGLGLGLVGFAAVRVIRGGGKTESNEVGIVPIRGGSMVAWSSAW